VEYLSREDQVMSLSPGDLVEVVNTPPAGRRVIPAAMIGSIGIVVSGEYYVSHPNWRNVGIHDVSIGGRTIDIATALLRKISGPPADVIPTLTEVVA
jgi:hypothetical protein